LCDVPVSSCMQHEHGVNVYLAKERHRGVDNRQKLDLCCLLDLALVASLNVPFHVSLKGRPPEVVEKGAAGRIKALVAKLVMGVAN